MSGAGATHFVYDQDGQLLGQYAGTVPSQEFVWLGNVPVAVLNGASADPEVLYVFSDHLNAPRVLVGLSEFLCVRLIEPSLNS